VLGLAGNGKRDRQLGEKGGVRKTVKLSRGRRAGSESNALVGVDRVNRIKHRIDQKANRGGGMGVERLRQREKGYALGKSESQSSQRGKYEKKGKEGAHTAGMRTMTVSGTYGVI